MVVSLISVPLGKKKFFSLYLLIMPEGIVRNSRLLTAFIQGYVSVFVLISPIRPSKESASLQYTTMYYLTFVIEFERNDPFFFFSHTSSATKLEAPNISSQIDFSAETSLSSMEIKITPSSERKFRDTSNLA